MMNEYHPDAALLEEIKELRRELAEANSIINAIKHGEVDALLISNESSDQVYVLKGADHIYRVLVEEMQEGCATIASNGVILFCNKNFADIVKFPLDRIIGSSIYNFIKPQDLGEFASFLSAREGSFKAEYSLKTGDGYSTPVIMSAISLTLDGDPFTCLVVTDLTVQRHSERFVQMIFSQAKEPIIACDRTGLITQANPAAAAMLKGQLVGSHFDTAIPLFYSSDGTSFKLSDAIHSDHTYGLEVQYVQTDDKPLTLLINAGKFNSENDSLVGCVVMLTDITDKCLLAEELARLDRLNVIGEMAAGIGHEVRNPLTTVRGYLQLFTRKAKYADDHEQFEIMIEELDRANLIITEFLSLAKNKAVELKPGNLNDTIHALFPMLQADAFRLGHEIQIVAGSIDVFCYDSKEIRQLILNLVRNGLEAMPTSGILTIRTYSESDKIILAIEDTGTGIAEDIANKLGTPFITTKEAGTGLGLSICYRIAERHGAKIELKTSSAGTTFFIKFNAEYK
jgi:PAS domain S-box-containing protein